MRPDVRVVLIIIVSCLLGIDVSPADNQPLTLSISAAERVVHIGAELKIKTTLTNVTNHVIALRDSIRACDYPLDVRDQRGNPAPETDYQHRLKCKARFTESRNILVRLKPGESRDDEIIVNQLFELNSPGDYSVQVSRTVPKELARAPIKSNIVTISVTK